MIGRYFNKKKTGNNTDKISTKYLIQFNVYDSFLVREQSIFWGYINQKSRRRSTKNNRKIFSKALFTQKQRQCVDELQSKLDAAKARYKAALNNLEKISLEIHQKRQLNAQLKALIERRNDAVDCSCSEDDSISGSGDLDVTGPKAYGICTSLRLIRLKIVSKQLVFHEMPSWHWNLTVGCSLKLEQTVVLIKFRMVHTGTCVVNLKLFLRSF